VNVQVVTPMLLLLLLGLAFSIGTTLVFFAARAVKRRHRESERDGELSVIWSNTPAHMQYLNRPACWLAIKSPNLLAVQAALGLNNPTPCGWTEGLEKKLFIAPPVKGWVLVLGSGLPDPADDVDRCYRFVTHLSRKLGPVQLFSWSRVLNHHAWVRADGGRIVRAFAWAGRTVWKEGQRTPPEIDLDLKCPEYGETFEPSSFGQVDAIAANVDRLPLLAARWSLDPALIEDQRFERETGIAGEPSTRF
jgi:hypothetical protein